MGDAMAADVPEMKPPRKSVKRKRAAETMSLSVEERESRIEGLREELNGLLEYYEEERKKSSGWEFSGSNMNSRNAAIACLLEESSLPLSELVGEIFEKVKGREGFDGVTAGVLKSSVLLIGQRSFYGVPNPDADVLEDGNPSCLWCWETRDTKLIPKSVRGALKIRRTCRKKIHERITAVSALITELVKSESHPNDGLEVMKASDRLGKVLSEAEIRSLIESMVQKSAVDAPEKEVKREEKLKAKQLERSKREGEKEKKRMERELQKDKLLSEKEMKRLQEEAEKVERRREKEESEMKKLMRKQQEAEKDQRRREKEEAELKRQLALQKQASLLEHFLKKGKDNFPSQSDRSPTSISAADALPMKREKMPESVTQSMDYGLSLKEEIDVEDIWRSRLKSWYHLGRSSNRKQHWGIRQRPKTEVVKELKLTTSRGLSCDDESSVEKVVNIREKKGDSRSCSTNADDSVPSILKCGRSKQLLQFDKSHRPAFYGIWPKKSQAVRARRPMVKDPNLDYEIDSDEEWEEEEPGESLSYCDKEDEEESMEERFSQADDEDESEDGFFVPDGYLSENEGVQVERRDCNDLIEEGSLPSCKQVESEELHVLLQQNKHLHNLTEQALRKNRPLLVLNLMHEKTQSAKDLTNTAELEQMCLQALSIRPFPVGPCIEISVCNNVQEVDQEDHLLIDKCSITPVASAAAVLDSDLPQIVSVIHSGAQGMNKVVESLHQIFPTFSKSVLRNKVREISNFNSTDNRWQVKKEILSKLGLSQSPDKSSRRTKSIAAFFSKRCLPPSGKSINPNETSPQMQKPPAAVELLQNTSTQNPQ